MFSRELIEKLEGKRIVKADLVASAEAGFKCQERKDHGSDSEHLKLTLDTGFIIYLPYQQVTMIDRPLKK